MDELVLVASVNGKLTFFHLRKFAATEQPNLSSTQHMTDEEFAHALESGAF